MENKFKVGQEVRVIGGKGSHAFKLGAAVTIVSVPTIAGDYYQASGEDKNSQGNNVTQYMFEEQLQEVIDFAQPLYTAEGTPVEYVSHRGRDPKFPVLAYEGKAKKMSKFTVTGEHSSGEARRALTNNVPAEVAEPSEDVFVNLYEAETFTRDQFGGSIGNGRYVSVEAADKEYKESRAADQTMPKRVGVAKLTLVKGVMPQSHD